MKQHLLLGLSAAISVVTMAQNNQNINMKPLTKTNMNLLNENIQLIMPPRPLITKNTNVPSLQAVTADSIGTSGNVFTLIGAARTCLWADPSINAVVLAHRHEVGTGNAAVGYLTYDFSTNGGAYGSWKKNGNTIANPVSVFDPSLSANSTGWGARYPQGAIYNPSGNTVADSAYFCYYGPTRDQTNPSSPDGDWGGHCFGVHQISGLKSPTQRDISSDVFSQQTAGFKFYIPDGYFMTKTGVVYNLDQEYIGTNIQAQYAYNDSLILTKGIWNNTTKDFDYTRTKIAAPMSVDDQGNKRFVESKITFADDGQLGYITIIGHNSYVTRPDSTYYIIVMKTTNGGASWGEPFNIMVDGVDPIFFTNGSSYKYTTGFEHDAVIDSLNNLHIAVPIGLQPIRGGVPVGWSIASAVGNWGLFDVYTKDGGNTWNAKMLGNPLMFRGDFGLPNSTASPQVIVDTRIQASRNWNGSRLFFTWFDTDTVLTSSLGGTANGQNNYPDMFSIGYDLKNDKWTNSNQTTERQATNMTIGSTVSTSVYFGTVSYYTFDNGTQSTIPCAFIDNFGLTGTGDPVQLRYINNASFDNTSFTSSTSTDTNYVSLGLANSIKNGQIENQLVVSQNYPNPFSKNSTVIVNLTTTATVTMEVVNSLGQVVSTQTQNNLSAGPHMFTIDASNLNPGIYFYTVKTGAASVTKKMTIQ